MNQYALNLQNGDFVAATAAKYAAQNAKEPALHITQHGKQKIIPSCKSCRCRIYEGCVLNVKFCRQRRPV